MQELFNMNSLVTFVLLRDLPQNHKLPLAIAAAQFDRNSIMGPLLLKVGVGDPHAQLIARTQRAEDAAAIAGAPIDVAMVSGSQAIVSFPKSVPFTFQPPGDMKGFKVVPTQIAQDVPGLVINAPAALQEKVTLELSVTVAGVSRAVHVTAMPRAAFDQAAGNAPAPAAGNAPGQ
jgi:hypothetical protein